MGEGSRNHGLAAALLLAVLPFMASAGTGTLANRAAPDFALKDTTGENLRLSEYRGRIVIVAFWAGWCGRCTLELEALADLKRARPDAVDVLTVNLDRDGQAASDAARRLALPVLRDPEGLVARQYDLDDLPVTVLVDQHGQVRRVQEKYRDGDVGLLERELDRLLAD